MPKFRDFVEGEWKAARYDHFKLSTRKGVDNDLKTQLLPNFGTLPLDRITRSRVNRWFDQYSRSAPGGANHTLDILSGILNHAIVCGHIAANPVRGVRRNPRQKMTRFLSREEIRRLHAVLDACMVERPVYAPAADIIRLLLLTGCRRGEILNLQWSEVGEDILELVDSKTGPRTVFLSPKAKAVIERQPRSDSPWVFPSPSNREKPRSANAFDRIWKLTRKRAGIEDVRLHDLRHSCRLAGGPQRRSASGGRAAARSQPGQHDAPICACGGQGSRGGSTKGGQGDSEPVRDFRSIDSGHIQTRRPVSAPSVDPWRQGGDETALPGYRKEKAGRAHNGTEKQV